MSRTERPRSFVLGFALVGMVLVACAGQGDGGGGSVANGTWPADGRMHGVDFAATPARYIRFIALAVNSGNAAANEIVVGGPQSLTVKTPTTSEFGH